MPNAIDTPTAVSRWLRMLNTATILILFAQPIAQGQVPKEKESNPPHVWNAAQHTALKQVDSDRAEINEINQTLWKFAEPALLEKKSSELLVAKLKAAGFTVETGVAGMPTAFVATYGSGKPVIGILAEYDALPGMSQKISSQQEPLTDGAAGHACGHSGLGAAAIGAAIAARTAMEQHHLPGTLKVFGTPAEETVVGKVYMALAGTFQDLDACLHWHPSDRNDVWAGSSKALISAQFHFRGTSAHAASNPDKGLSALDAVELMNVGVNFYREHVSEDARIHYVISNGGDVPNVVPAKAAAWYFIRADSHDAADRYFERVHEIAQGAALMTRTKLKVEFETDCHELIPNTPLSEMIQRNLQAVSPPKFNDAEKAFATKLQQSLIEQFGVNPKEPLDESLRALTDAGYSSKGSTDVGDVSWLVPTSGFRTTCFAAESPGHSWQNVATIGSTIGEKGIDYAAKVLAVSAVELLENPEQVAAAKADWKTRMKDRKCTTRVPAGQKPRATKQAPQ